MLLVLFTCVAERKANTCCSLICACWLAAGTDDRTSWRKLRKATTTTFVRV